MQTKINKGFEGVFTPYGEWNDTETNKQSNKENINIDIKHALTKTPLSDSESYAQLD